MVNDVGLCFLLVERHFTYTMQNKTIAVYLFQGGHVLTPLPAATPMKPGSAVSK